GRFSHKRYIYLALIQAALAEQVRGGKAVYHGLAGHLLLKGAPGLLRLRIIAPLEFRAGMAQERLKLGHDEAIAHIGAMDRERRRWAQFLYGVDWGDPSLYDLTINLGHMSIERACRLVAAAAEQGEFSAREQAAMNDFVLASRVRAVLAQSVYTFHLEVEVECRQGRIAILGDALDEDREAILGAAAGVPGVAAVTLGEASPIRTPAGHP
ncbi:MAG TPA: cytidylate kinase family protein, partial [Candidatus Sulfopaludibacter sp.]|nr:cytidylate kinase family protein [Candidatus Sulfopaludibacter sp.]